VEKETEGERRLRGDEKRKRDVDDRRREDRGEMRDVEEMRDVDDRRREDREEER